MPRVGGGGGLPFNEWVQGGNSITFFYATGFHYYEIQILKGY